MNDTESGQKSCSNSEQKSCPTCPSSPLMFLVLLVLLGILIYGFQSIFSGGGTPAKDWIGKELPDIEFKMTDGTPAKLSDYRGRQVVLNFWATWCGPCRGEIPDLNRLSAELPQDKALVIGISVDTEIETVNKFLDTTQVDYTVVHQTGSPPLPYSAIGGIPTTLFIDETGVLRKVHIGGLSMSPDQYEKIWPDAG